MSYRTLQKLLPGLFVLVVLAATPKVAADPWDPILPPERSWSGASEALIVPDDDPWVTPAELDGFRRTPDAAATRTWLERLAEASPLVRIETFGHSGAGRELTLVIAGREGSVEDLRSGAGRPPVVLAQAGIHGGEIDGKDAGMMLLRDLAVGSQKAENLLDRVTLLFVPIFNLDGHERVEAFSRINQRGPENAGWRTNARNLNLNRDWTKVDTPEVRALLGVVDAWDPDLLLDLHVTDGADYLYDVTWGHVGPMTWSPAIAAWFEGRFDPTVTSVLQEAGHSPGPMVFAADWRDITQGLQAWEAPPRFSDGYGDVRHLPTVLIENHSLEPYRRRVLGTRVFLEAVLKLLAAEGDGLRDAIGEDRARRTDEVVLSWTRAEEPTLEWIESFQGTESRRVTSPIGDDERLEWLGTPNVHRLSVAIPDVPGDVVTRPTAYWVPQAWTEVLEVLSIHGVETEVVEDATTRTLERLWLVDAELATEPFEGRVQVMADVRTEVVEERIPAGAIRVTTDQPLGDLVVHLLEPRAPDSLFRWGFFHSVLSRTEYYEAYVLDPVAEKILAEDADTAREWNAALENPELAADPRARREWWYQRSPWLDPAWKLYPIRREPRTDDADRASEAVDAR